MTKQPDSARVEVVARAICKMFNMDPDRFISTLVLWSGYYWTFYDDHAKSIIVSLDANDASIVNRNE